MSKNNEIIDAVTKINKSEQERIEGERGSFNIGTKAKQLPLGGKAFLIVILLCATVISGVFIWKAFQVKEVKQVSKDHNVIRNTLPALKPITPKIIENPKTKEELSNVESTIPEPTNITNNIKEPLKPAEAIKTRKLSPALKGNAQGNSSDQQTPNNADYSNNSELQNKLEPLRLDPAVAGKISNSDYLLTQGNMIDCQLETKMITTQPGMTSCYVTRNIYSSNGRVILIDRGSKIVGNYQGGMQQGQARIFVLWSRIETPKGVIVNLDSPGSGALGESGVGGYIDNHFFQRFSGAIMMSLIGDLGQYARNKAQQGNTTTNTIQFGNTTQGMQQAATEALQNSINIPPTLHKNQGERITIFVARDLDFGAVYELKYRQ